MGVYAIAAATIGILAVLRSTGLNNYLIREPLLSQSILATAFTVNMALATLSSCILICAGRLSRNSFDDAGVEHVLQVLAISPILSVFEFLPAAILERTGRLREVSTIGFLKSVLNTAVTIALAVQGFSFMSIAWGNLAGAGFAAIAMSTIKIPYRKFHVSLAEWRPISTFALQMMTLGVIGSISERLLEILLGRFAGLTALGLFSRASGLNGLLWDNVHLLISRVVLIDFSERVRHGQSLRGVYLETHRMITALLWPAFAGLSILSGPVILNLYGDEWLDAATPLSLLCLSGILYTTVTMSWELYIIRGKMRAQLRFQATRAVCGLVLFTMGCINGLLWAAASRIGDALITVCIARRDVERMTDTSIRDYPPIIAQSAALAALGSGPALMLMLHQSWSPRTSLGLVTYSVLIGIASWIIGLWLLQHPLYRELARFICLSRDRLSRWIGRCESDST